MKKLFLIILFIICLPVIINAKSYTVEMTKTNNYMNKSNYSNTYKRYLLYNTGNNLKLGFSHGKVVKDGDFDTVTGFISAEEYTLTIPSVGTSYLYDGTTYWILTGSDEKQTVFFSEPIIDNGLKELPKNTTNPNIDSRATVYVDPETNVTGTGKQTDPWIFVPRFQVTVKVSDRNHSGLKKIDDNSEGLGKAEMSELLTARKTSDTGAFTLKVVTNPGYMLMSNDCNGKVTDTDNINQKIFTVSNVSRDTKCTLAIGTGIFTIKLGDKNYDNTDINPIYFRHSDNYYSNENYTNIIRKIKKPIREGYTFDGYLYNSKEIIDKDGNLKDKVSITSTNTKDEKGKDIVLLTSAWHPNEYEVEFIPNGGKIGGSTASIKRKYLYERQYKERYASFPFVTRAGYSFSGWYTKASGGTKVTVDDILNTLGKKLYAHWDICKKGTYNNGSLASCESCDKGTYQDKEGQTGCNDCVAGSYQNEVGQSSCKACDGGKTSVARTVAACTENCKNTTGVATWKKPEWLPNNEVSNLCSAATCSTCYKLSNTSCTVQNTFYVSNNGNDNNSGYESSKPFKTISKAYSCPGNININLLSNITQKSQINFNQNKIVVLKSNSGSYKVSRDSSLKNGSILYLSSGKISILNVVFDGKNIESTQPLISVSNSTIDLNNGVILQNGINSLTNSDTCGGGIFTNNSIVNVNGATFKKNKAGKGAGIALLNSNLTFNSGTVSDNSVRSQGGGIWFWSNGGVHTSYIKGGTISNNYSPEGGGIWFASNNGSNNTLNISGSDIKNNTANFGAGVFISAQGAKSTLNLSGGTISNNTASSNGGGVATTGWSNVGETRLNMTGGSINSNSAVYGGGGLYFGSWEGTKVIGSLSGGTISYNTTSAGWGGGIQQVGPANDLTISGNNSINNNQSKENGGAIDIYNGKLTINGGTISNNVAYGADGGGGIHIREATVNLNGGKITNNDAPNAFGGGVQLQNNATTIFNFYSGEISGNKCGGYSSCGGGVSQDKNAKYNKTGGSLYNNSPQNYNKR